jgi:hypothetical protein
MGVWLAMRPNNRRPPWATGRNQSTSCRPLKATAAILNGIALHRLHLPGLQRLHAPDHPPRRPDGLGPVYVCGHDSVDVGESDKQQPRETMPVGLVSPPSATPRASGVKGRRAWKQL